MIFWSRTNPPSLCLSKIKGHQDQASFFASALDYLVLMNVFGLLWKWVQTHQEHRMAWGKKDAWPDFFLSQVIDACSLSGIFVLSDCTERNSRLRRDHNWSDTFQTCRWNASIKWHQRWFKRQMQFREKPEKKSSSQSEKIHKRTNIRIA